MTAKIEGKEIIVDLIPPSDLKPKSQDEIEAKGANYWYKNFKGMFKVASYWYNRHQTEHQAYIALNGVVEELRNEFNGLLKKRNVDVEKLVIEEEASDYAAHRDIQEVVNEHKKSNWFKVTWAMVGLILGLVFILEMAFNQQFAKIVNDNMPIIVGGAVLVIIGAVVFYVSRRR